MPGRFHNLELSEDRCQEQDELALQTKADFDADAYLTQADEAHRLGEFETALRLYTRCLERDRTVIPAWVGQVQMLVQMDECREARMWADKALELFRDNGDLLAGKAQACARLNDRRASFACSDGALQAPGSSPWRWQARGEVLLAAKQPHHAECFQKSLAEPAADWFDHVIIARIYAYYDRLTNALSHATSANAAEPSAAVTWLEMGRYQTALGLLTAAHDSYARCLELRPELHAARVALNNLGSLSFFDWLKSLFRRRRR